MRIDQLPSPGMYSNAPRLRTEAAKAISFAEITHDLGGTSATENHASLRDFFLACAAAVPGEVVDPDPGEGGGEDPGDGGEGGEEVGEGGDD